LLSAVSAACARIAPTWPLDQFIAVNPYWGFVDRPITEVAARLATLSGTSMLMPRAFYREQWQSGALTREHLQRAIDAAGTDWTVEQLVAGLETPSRSEQSRLARSPSTQGLPDLRLPRITDLADQQRDLTHAMAWRDFVTHHISQCCAAYFDQGQSAWAPDRQDGLYRAWLQQSAHDRSPRLLMRFKAFGERLPALPGEPLALIEAAVHALGVPEAVCEDYFTSLLLDINGWASWCAYRRWQARLSGGDDDHLIQLLAIRLAWEWLLIDAPRDPVAGPADGEPLARRLVRAWNDREAAVTQARQAESDHWLLQAAMEQAYQATLVEGLLAAPDPAVRAAAGVAAAGVATAAAAASVAHAPEVQAVFCIDVRSEVFRRALEASSAQVQTLGFAGFFGLPVAYAPLGTRMSRPQLPGLLAPTMMVTDQCVPALGDHSSNDANTASAADAASLPTRRQRALQWRQRWQDFRSTAGSAFSFVESLGLLYGAKLLQRSLDGQAVPQPVEQLGVSSGTGCTLRPRLQAAAGVSAAEQASAACDLAGAILGLMGLRSGLARVVLLAGHGSQTSNNPHAAGLDCGACGGQTGEVNARALAALLNDPAVRQGLAARGKPIPEHTWFLAGLHNTTTDELPLFDLDLLPASHAADVAQLQAWLAEAGARTRAERAPALGLTTSAEAGGTPLSVADLLQAVHTRACDWAEVRPEWGLAGNAAFVVAPRTRTRHLDLAGRSFLHDYDYRSDDGWGTLELIMTAPMVVTHWINMQYYASTVDNRRYGSGNKVLHNVVGGRLGVFEGNGGDLRIGLPWQSLHDGETLHHLPLRLSVFIEAPQAAVDGMLAKHAAIRQLLDNAWLFLFLIDPAGGGILRYRRGQWIGASR